MQTQQRQYRQGDVFIFAATIPSDAQPVPDDPRGLVLAAGTATGHHHRIGPGFKNAVLFRSADGTRTFLRVTPLKGGVGVVDLTHEEHDTIPIPPDDYEVYIQREYTPGGVQRVED